MATSNKKCVTFNESLNVIHVIYDCPDSKAARCGYWHVDNMRFKRKIQTYALILDPILSDSHRDKMFKRM